MLLIELAWFAFALIIIAAFVVITYWELFREDKDGPA